MEESGAYVPAAPARNAPPQSGLRPASSTFYGIAATGSYTWIQFAARRTARRGSFFSQPSPMRKVKDFSALLIKHGKTWLYSASEVLKNAQ